MAPMSEKRGKRPKAAKIPPIAKLLNLNGLANHGKNWRADEQSFKKLPASQPTISF